MAGVGDGAVAWFKSYVGGRATVAPVRSTAMGTLDTCARMFLYSERLGLRLKSYESAPSRGSMYHSLLHHYRIGGSLARGQAAVQAFVVEESLRLKGLAGPDGLLPGGQDVATVMSNLQQDCNLAVAMAEAFVGVYPFPFEAWEVVRYTPEKVMSEVLYDWVVDGTPVRVRFDCVVRNKTTGEVWVVDDKTTSLDPVVRAASLSFGWQTLLYTAVMRGVLTESSGEGGTLAGVCHNVIRTPTIRYCGKDASFEAYVNRVSQWYRDEREKNPARPPILQSWTRLKADDGLSPEFLRKLKAQHKAHRSLPRLPLFPRNEKACFHYNRPCPYLDLCQSDSPGWPRLLDAKFEVRFREDEEDEPRE